MEGVHGLPSTSAQLPLQYTAGVKGDQGVSFVYLVALKW